MLFRFKRTRQPEAGAEGYSFISGFGNPAFPLYKGPGVPYYGTIMALQPPPMVYHQAVPRAGYGGLVYATNYFAPLMKKPGK